jgi:hypothetical protein
MLVLKLVLFILFFCKLHIFNDPVKYFRAQFHFYPGLDIVADLEYLHVTFLYIITHFSVVFPLLKVVKLLVSLLIIDVLLVELLTLDLRIGSSCKLGTPFMIITLVHRSCLFIALNEITLNSIDVICISSWAIYP